MILDEQVAVTKAILLKSYLFRSKPQMRRLLKYLIKHTYKNNETALQQRLIAINCLGRGKSFDPAKDPIVRIEAARLRKLLDTFYEQESFTPPPYRVSLPKGSYALSFSRNLENKLSAGLSLLLVCQGTQFATESSTQLMLRVRRDLSIRLTKFRHLTFTVDFSTEAQVAERGVIHYLSEDQYDYVLRMEVVDNLNQGYLLSSIAIHRKTQEILWSQSSALAKDYDNDQLDLFYKQLISPLIADAYGLLGKHWSQSLLAQGVENVPDHQVSYVYYIAVCNAPSLEMCQQFLDFLVIRLERFPQDYVARAGYLTLGFFDYFLDYNLIQDNLDDRLHHALEAIKYYPNDDGFPVLAGFCYFLLKDYTQAKMYLSTAKLLNSDNTFWEFIDGSLLYFMGEKERGIEKIISLRALNPNPPGYYYIPEFFYCLDEGKAEDVFTVASHICSADRLETVIKALAFLCIGADEQANKEFEKVRNDKQGGVNWVQNRLLQSYPLLAKKIDTMLSRLSPSAE